MAQTETVDGRAAQEFAKSRENASFQVVVSPEHMGWIHAALLNAPHVELFNGAFLPPFDSLSVITARRENQLISISTLAVGSEFDDQIGTGVVNDQIIGNLTKRYPQTQVSDDGSQVLLVDKKGEPAGIIGRTGDRIVIQTGGQAGHVEISDKTPVNDLSIGLTKHALLLQRYISSVLRCTDAYATQLALQLMMPQLPEGAVPTYFSTKENVLREFVEHPKPLDFAKAIGGYKKAKDAFNSILLDLDFPEISRQHGTKPYNDKLVLLTGDEGTGKSLFPKGVDTEMRARAKEKGTDFNHFRVQFGDIIQTYGASTAQILTTLFEQAYDNEANGIPTLIHLDGLHHLISPLERTGRVLPNGEARIRPTPTESEFNFEFGVLAPIRNVIRKFGAKIGNDSKHIVVIGESREKRDELPDAISRTFRRSLHLEPTEEDLGEIVEVQVAIARENALGTGVDPFEAEFDTQIARIAQEAFGMTGFNIKQALIGVISRNKSAWKIRNDTGLAVPTQDPVTVEDFINELRSMKGIQQTAKKGLGFHNFARPQ